VQEVVQDMDFTLLDACETKPNVRLLPLASSMGYRLIQPFRAPMTGHDAEAGRGVRHGQDCAICAHPGPHQHLAASPAIRASSCVEASSSPFAMMLTLIVALADTHATTERYDVYEGQTHHGIGATCTITTRVGVHYDNGGGYVYMYLLRRVLDRWEPLCCRRSRFPGVLLLVLLPLLRRVAGACERELEPASERLL
jgi:hypothetical protein